MCCIDVDPIDFMKWAKPIIEKKEAILTEAEAEVTEEKAAYNRLPWYRKMFSEEPGTGWGCFFYEEAKLIRRGYFKLPTVDKKKYVPLAAYCAAKGIKMPLPTDHDFFKG